MQCVYINMENAPDRRARFEANWTEYRGDDWRIERFPALDARYVEQHRVGGTLRPGEKGCFLSHCAVIGLNVDATEPLFILEDDSLLGPRSAATIGNFLHVSDAYDWDIVFTEVCIPQASTMIDLMKLSRQLRGADEVRLLDLANYVFAGSTGYIVNHRSLKKIAALLGAHQELDLPYDLALRKLVYEKKLKALAFFPFVTALSTESGPSQIRDEVAADRIWIAFRQLVALDRDLDKLRPIIEQIGDELCDEEARLLGMLLGAQASKSFVPK
jgi:GR25 family glycosyltransferase involved in LPS biosynthesis